MENWRRFLKEAPADPNLKDPEMETLTAKEKWTQAMTRQGGSPTAFAPGGEHAYNRKDLQKLHPEVLRVALSIVDPTGILSWPDLPPAYQNYKKEKNTINLFLLILAAISVVPIVGSLGKAAKAKKLSQSLDKAEELADTLGSVEGTAALGKTLKQEVIESRESLDKLWHYVHNSHDDLWDSPEFLEGLLKLNKTGLAASYTGRAYRGLKADSLKSLLQQININPEDPAAKTILKLIKDTVNRGAKEKYVYISFDTLNLGAEVSSRSKRGLIPFSKDRNTAHEFATVVDTQKTGTPKISAVVHTTISASDEVLDVAGTMKKVDDTIMPPNSRSRPYDFGLNRYLGVSSRVRQEEELLVFGASRKIDGIWIMVNH